MFKLTKKHDWFNPYFLNGKQVSKINFFNSDGVQGSVSWFGANNHYPELAFNTEVKNKRKIDFNTKTAFCVKDKETFNDGNIIVYVPLSCVEHSEVKEIIKKDVNFIHTYKEFSVKVLIRHYQEKEITLENMDIKTLIRHEKTNHYKQLEQKAKEIKDKLRIEVSAYHIEELKKLLN